MPEHRDRPEYPSRDGYVTATGCLVCGADLPGRTDQRYCGHACHPRGAEADDSTAVEESALNLEMVPIPDQAVATLFQPRSLLLLTTDSPAVVDLPAGWREIVQSTDAAVRCSSALQRWSASFVARTPSFMAEFRSRLADVRVAELGGEIVLVYVAHDLDDELIGWVGLDPRTYVNPPYADRFPAWLLEFLREVHAGFTAPDGESYGPMVPRSMETLAERLGAPDGFDDWDDGAEIPSTRLLFVTTEDHYLDYYVSPDLPAESIGIVFEGDLDAEDFAPELDRVMTAQFKASF